MGVNFLDRNLVAKYKYNLGIKRYPILVRVSFIALLTVILSYATFAIAQNKIANAIVPPTVLGELSYQQYDTHSLGSRAKLLVNAANGNLIVDTNEFGIKSVGPSMSVNRYFNNLASGSGQNGHHGTFGFGGDVTITANPNGSATYNGPSGIEIIYPSNGSGGYNLPASYTAAKLTTVSGGGWKLTFNKTGEYYLFDSNGKQIEHTNRDGQSIDYTYSSNGTLDEATDAQGHVLKFENYNGTKVGKISDNSGRYVIYTYNGDKLTSSNDILGRTWQYQYYDTRGNVNQIVDPRGYTTTLTYDSSNRVTSIKMNDYTSDIAEYTYTYDNANSKTIVTDPLNHDTTYTYDSNGRVTQVKNAVGSTNGATWDANNNQTASLDPSNYATTSTYDSYNNLTQVKNPSLANGNPGAKSSYAYTDAANPYQQSSQTSGQGNVTSYSYNTSGNLSSSSSGSGTGAVAVNYKREGDPDGSGGTITCTAQPGQVCSSVDGKGNTTTYTYNSIGNLLTVDHPAPEADETFTYDNLSRVKTYTDGNNSTVTTEYDNMDRPTKKTYSSDASLIFYTYDENGNLLEQKDAAGQTNYEYDGFNRATKIAQSTKPDISYTYDKSGNLKTELGTAGTITYSYDNANQITGVNHSATGANYTIGYTSGRPTTVTLPGGINQTITYDRAGRQTSIKAVKGTTTLTNYTATYINSAGSDRQLMQSEKNVITGVTTTYGYDGLERLVSANGSAGTGSHDYTYSYDKNGNRTQTSKDGVYSAIYGYNDANELVSSGGASYGSYDSATNQTSNGTGMTLSYNAKNQTSSITPSGSSTQNATYLGDSQTKRTAFGSTSYQNGLLGLYSETTGSLTTSYTHLPSGTNQIIGQIIGSNPYYYLTDIRGSTVAMTNSTGTVVNKYTYDPYGKQLTTTGSTTNKIKYSGGYQDTTGLYKFGARYYNTTEGRWTQKDPSGQDDHYVYANNDPVNFSDPSGYFSFTIGGTATGAIGGCIIGGYALGFAGPYAAAFGCVLGAGVGANRGYVIGGYIDDSIYTYNQIVN